MTARRLLRAAGLAASCVLLIGSVACWVWSHTHQTDISRVTTVPDAPEIFPDTRFARMWRVLLLDGRIVVGRESVDVTRNLRDHAFRSRTHRRRAPKAGERQAVRWSYATASSKLMPRKYGGQTRSVGLLGVSVSWFDYPPPSDEHRQRYVPGRGLNRGWTVGIPWSYITAVVALPIAVTLLRSLRARGRRRRGLCPHCRYDLRATPGRCPECGGASAPAGLSPVAG